MSAQQKFHKWGLALAFLSAASFAVFSACHVQTKEEKARQLAEKYCGSCHLPVDPSMLDKATWTDHVLPNMAKRLGVNVWGEKEYFPPMPGEKPGQIPFSEWKEIVEYYTTNAPEKLTPAKAPYPVQKGWAGFELVAPVIKDTTIAATTMVAADATAGMIYTSDAYENTLVQWNATLEKANTWKCLSPIVDISFKKDSGKNLALITQIGDMRAVDKPSGVIAELDLNTPGIKPTDLKAFLQRPVQTLSADFDKDGLVDLISCSFGHNTGGLYLLKKLPTGSYDQHPILELPGAIHAVVDDFNNDGWPDLMVLFAAAREGIWLFQNDHKGGFTSDKLLEFPPLWGSTSFQLIDMNGDGKKDIVYTCGDNADYSMILKPYHGVYVFENKGNNQYKQAWFYPVNGCTKAIAGDFNQDGKVDIATIAFFADLKNNPSEKFIFFEGKDNAFNFAPYSPPIENEGHWICMDAVDVDKDGDVDIILGNYAKGFIIQEDYRPNWKEYQPFILLRNTLKHP
ncbi:FG-GAP-like repeat-containing protein [Chitinophaga sp. Cy-1792]|uniref:FG-GAP-like repeat-containing protein n=1 Tax=Chitinophaga sp. Cy-1792 TaxID=2608339 RepID=UPI00142231AA|nr:FG-GAP-like repeat-containing protein [Chitinophaga sp. Cy-1792]NIG53020.1 VCBS repeat-containing protein [Chitinophaga sp. Cy-1792]